MGAYQYSTLRALGLFFAPLRQLAMDCGCLRERRPGERARFSFFWRVNPAMLAACKTLEKLFQLFQTKLPQHAHRSIF